MTSQELADIAIRNQVLLERLKSQSALDYNSVFNEIEDAMSEILRGTKTKKLSDLTKQQFQSTLAELRVEQQRLLDRQMDRFLGQVQGISEHVANLEKKALQTVLKPTAQDILIEPTAQELADAAMNRPIQATGTLLKPLVQNFSTETIQALNGAIITGHQQGMTTEQIIDKVVGTKSLNYKDGVTAVKRRHAATVVRTGLQHVANTAREVTWEQNGDLIKGVQWLSTLDGRTTSQCQALDGRKFKLKEGPRPPIHPNCRSTTTPDLDDTFDFLDEGATRSSQGGYVEAKKSYYDWLKDQSSEFQDEVLGDDLGQMFRGGGLSTKRFAELRLDKNFSPITLARMKELEPLAFKRAGVS